MYFELSKVINLAFSHNMHLGRVLLGSTESGWLGFFVSTQEKSFSVGLFDQHCQPASNQVKRVERASPGVPAFQPKMVGKVFY